MWFATYLSLHVMGGRDWDLGGKREKHRAIELEIDHKKGQMK